MLLTYKFRTCCTFSSFLRYCQDSLPNSFMSLLRYCLLSKASLKTLQVGKPHSGTPYFLFCFVFLIELLLSIVLCFTYLFFICLHPQSRDLCLFCYCYIPTLCFLSHIFLHTSTSGLRLSSEVCFFLVHNETPLPLNKAISFELGTVSAIVSL